MATPLRLEKYGRIDFSPGRWTPMGQNASKLVRTHAKDEVEVGRNFFTFTFKAVAVTFLEVIFDLPKKVLNWQFWISLAVVSYLFPPVFLTSIPHLCCIPQHCLSLHAGYWRKKKRDLDQNLVRIVVFSVPSIDIHFQENNFQVLMSTSNKTNTKYWHFQVIN